MIVTMGDRVPIIGISRHRLETDGEGITTLVAFHSCPLRCRYCLNPQSINNVTDKVKWYKCEELYEKVKIDELYFLATNGGVTFGGGEPMLRHRFINEFRKLCGANWRIYVETSLNVPQECLCALLDVVDGWIVDVKDMNSTIYCNYTGNDNAQVVDNLQLLCDNSRQYNTLIRLPHIPGFNTYDDRLRSRERLERMGFERFDMFDYIKRNHDE